MKKIISLICALFITLVTCACACNKDDNTIEFTHYVKGGGSEELDATILWEYETSAYTKYQVAYTSYVCSDSSINFINVIYIELINVADKDPKIRNVSFSSIEADNQVTYNVGLWGDYIMKQGVPILEQVNEDVLPSLIGANYETIENAASTGYGNFRELDGVSEDVLVGATVSGSNIISIVKAIFDYHIEKYY